MPVFHVEVFLHLNKTPCSIHPSQTTYRLSFSIPSTIKDAKNKLRDIVFLLILMVITLFLG